MMSIDGVYFGADIHPSYNKVQNAQCLMLFCWYHEMFLKAAKEIQEEDCFLHKMHGKTAQSENNIDNVLEENTNANSGMVMETRLDDENDDMEKKCNESNNNDDMDKACKESSKVTPNNKEVNGAPMGSSNNVACCR